MITLQNIYKRFPLRAGLFAQYGQYVYAVNGVNIAIDKNESYGLVGESGSGKSTIAKIIAGVHDFDHGDLIIDGTEYREVFTRPHSVQYIFQDPATSLNPRQNIFQILTQGYHHNFPSYSKTQLIARVIEQLCLVGLSEDDLYRRPSEFSGGQRQRIAIARALMYDPTILICDEVVSALDLSIRTQIINLLLMLRTRLQITMLFIAHDLSLVSYFCDRVGVLYQGVLVEEANSTQLLQKRYHPYTERLFRSIPQMGNRERFAAGTDEKAGALAAPTHRSTMMPKSWQTLSPRPMKEVEEGHYVVEEES